MDKRPSALGQVSGDSRQGFQKTKEETPKGQSQWGRLTLETFTETLERFDGMSRQAKGQRHFLK